MKRGTFANVQLNNKIIGQPGPYTIHAPSGETLFVYDAAERYAKEHKPVIVMGGYDYGTG
jgi:aconitase A